ncbi:unnamed protein product [Trifolium pratense]|uniref:Uncharacterized protein n=1 Tax=Trifolium pratense TaxID=57577 RepID=A0ACB0J7C1_TRIPR|nr:unnamed protein product [Trifolium pratense]
MDKEGGFVTRPPLLVGASNYDYWKSRMMAFLKQIDSKTWKAILRGWTPPVKMDKDGKPTPELKSAEEWSKEEDELALANSKALYALYNGVDKHIFRLIKKCVCAKEAWTILETVHEGTSKVKLSKLQLLTTKFENLRMNDDETIQDFHMTILDFDNQFDALGEKIPEEKLVRKMLRSLPKKFDMKVTAIEEAKDITDMKLDELVGSLQTYEVATNEKMDKKNKSIAFVSNAEEEDQLSDTESEQSISDAMVLLGKQFNKVLKRMDKRSKTGAADIGRNTYRNFRKPVTDEKSAPNKGVQCHECEGFGHIRSECGTFLKKQKKGLTVTWSDEDSEGEADTAKAIHVLTSVCTSDTESCEEELTFDELAESYKKLCLKSAEVCRVSEEQKETITKLQTERAANLSRISEFSTKWEDSLKIIEEQKATIINLEADKIKQLTEIAHLNEEFVYRRRLALERNLKDDILECPSVVEALEYAGLMKTVVGLDKCYDRLVKEFLINVAANCNDPASPEYRQVFVRGKCVQFSPTVINQYLQRDSEEVAPLKVTDNEVCKVLTGGRIKVWPSKAKLAATSLSPFYAILNRIAAHNWVPTTHSGDVARGLGKIKWFKVGNVKKS